jgi:hypothetical protein
MAGGGLNPLIDNPSLANDLSDWTRETPREHQNLLRECADLLYHSRHTLHGSSGQVAYAKLARNSKHA